MKNLLPLTQVPFVPGKVNLFLSSLLSEGAEESSVLLEKYDTVAELLTNPANNHLTLQGILADFQAHGGEILGQGRYAQVLSHPSWKYVAKIFNSDSHYLKFVRFCLKNPRPSFPVFYDKPRKVIPNYSRSKSEATLYIVRTEKLHTISEQEFKDLSYIDYYAEPDPEMEAKYHNWKNIGDKWRGLMADNPSLKDYTRDLKFLMSQEGDFGTPDITRNNIMKRQNGQYVIADPFWEGETPYGTHDRLMRAEIGYEYEEYADYEKEPLVPEGKLPKKPRPVKTPIPTPKSFNRDDDDIPF